MKNTKWIDEAIIHRLSIIDLLEKQIGALGFIQNPVDGYSIQKESSHAFDAIYSSLYKRFHYQYHCLIALTNMTMNNELRMEAKKKSFEYMFGKKDDSIKTSIMEHLGEHNGYLASKEEEFRKEIESFRP